jgi:hypothetical protein
LRRKWGEKRTGSYPACNGRFAPRADSEKPDWRDR